LDAVRFNGAPQELAWGKDVRLPGIFIEMARTHPRRERLMTRLGGSRFSRGSRCRLGRCGKQIVP
jgi:hypothetical protein